MTRSAKTSQKGKSPRAESVKNLDSDGFRTLLPACIEWASACIEWDVACIEWGLASSQHVLNDGMGKVWGLIREIHGFLGTDYPGFSPPRKKPVPISFGKYRGVQWGTP